MGAPLLSALVCPGVGQFTQGRVVAGLFYSISFLGLFAALLWVVLVPMVHNLRVALDFAASTSNEPFMEVSWMRLALLFGLAMLVYFINIFDAIRAERKARTQVG